MAAHVHNEEEKGATEGENGEKEGENGEKKKSKRKSKGSKKGKEKTEGQEAGGKPATQEKKKETKIMSVEERDVGSVSWRVYADYAMAIGGLFLSGLIMFLYIGDQAAQVTSSWYAH